MNMSTTRTTPASATKSFNLITNQYLHLIIVTTLSQTEDRHFTRHVNEILSQLDPHCTESVDIFDVSIEA
jgi:hypothetical protein